jgi:hypothetical protein
MGEQYSQTLIPRDRDFVPWAGNVREFLSAIVALGVVPSKPSIILRSPSGETREFWNPFSGRKIVIELKSQKQLKTLGQFEKAAARLSDYDIEVSGEGRPKLSPIDINLKGRYFVGVTCFVSSTLRSTSDYHDESGVRKRVVPYGRPCTRRATTGIFTNPHNLEIIEIPNAGSARFWVQFELGKFLFPKIVNDDLELLNPKIVEAAEGAFGTRFVQGCFWG